MSDSSAHASRPQGRAVRVFVSSTFRDMEAEREELVKRVFPQLRKLCEQRGVTWGEVDLRWGITDEQKAEGQVLPVCLAEIQRCRPYFIGLLGQRYGWVPDTIAPELLSREPWLREHLSRSVTELEILHGVLRAPQMAEHAFFYFRSPAFLQGVPAADQPAYCESPSAEEIACCGAVEAERRAAGRRQKLAELKARIRSSGFPVREDYPDPQALGQLVLRDLIAVIEQRFPEGSQPDPLEREAAEHRAFAAARTDAYIGRPEYFQRLDAHAQGGGPPLVLLGPSGSGKSALLANWINRHREQHPEIPVFEHFIGGAARSTDGSAMLRRIMAELRRHYAIEGEIPPQPDKLRIAFANWLNMAAARGRFVLVLDALNQLEDRDAALDLMWLPPVLPANVRLVLSTLPGRPLDALAGRGWPTLTVQPLQPDERRHLIAQYLGYYAKALSRSQAERIASAPPAATPLYLRALLEELRLHGDHFTLDRQIEHYLAAATIDDLFERILARHEQDYDQERGGLTRDAMSLLYCARRGLSETELLDLLGAGDRPLPGAIWSPLYLSIEPSLVSYAGLLGFSHDYLRQAVADRYLPTAQERQAVHRRLAAYFAGRPLGPRQVEELPWQRLQAGDWEGLYGTLTDLPFFVAAWGADKLDVQAHWAQLEANSSFHMLDGYREVLEAPARHTPYLSSVAQLLYFAGHPLEAQTLWTTLAQRARQTGDLRELQSALGQQAIIAEDRGSLDEALALLAEVEQICETLGDGDGLATCLTTQATVRYRKGDLDAALELHRSVERTARAAGNKTRLARSLLNQGLILRDQGEEDTDRLLYEEARRLFLETGDLDWTARVVNNLATLQADAGNLREALALFHEAELISRRLGKMRDLAVYLDNQAITLLDLGRLDEASAVLLEGERICRSCDFALYLARNLAAQARLSLERDEIQAALSRSREAEAIYRSRGYRVPDLVELLVARARILIPAGATAEAAQLLDEAERLSLELKVRYAVAMSLAGRALLLDHRGDGDGAVKSLTEAEGMLEASKTEQADVIGWRGRIVRDQGRLDIALGLFAQQEQICRKMGTPAGLAFSLAHQASIRRQMGQADEARRLAGKAEQLVGEHGLKYLERQLAPALQAARA